MKSKNLEHQLLLLEDPDERVYSLIHEQIVKQGNNILPVLENLWSKTSKPIVNERIASIIDDINFQTILNQAQIWNQNYHQRLADFLALISKVFYPELDENDIKMSYLKIRNELWLEISDSLTGIEKIKVLNHILFQMNGFASTTSLTTHHNDFLLNEILKRKKGNDLGIGLLYLSLSQDLDLPVYGVNLPGNFVLAYNNIDWYQTGTPTEAEPLFYINPNNQGVILGKPTIKQHILAQNLTEKAEYYQPISLKATVIKYLNAIKNCIKKETNTIKLRKIEQIENTILHPKSNQ